MTKESQCNVIRHHRKNNFVILDTEIINNPKLSWKAKGLLTYLLSKPDGWQFYETEIAKRSKDGRDSVAAGLKELENEGYLERSWIRNERGKYIGRQWDVYENPYTGIQTDYGFYGAGKPDDGLSGIG